MYHPYYLYIDHTTYAYTYLLYNISGREMPLTKAEIILGVGLILSSLVVAVLVVILIKKYRAERHTYKYSKLKSTIDQDVT